MMTVSDISLLPNISKEWAESELLSDKIPIRISEVANIYGSDTSPCGYETEKQKYLSLVSHRISYPADNLMKAFFDIWLAEWVTRPVFRLDGPQEYPTCLPYNKKLYMDSMGKVGICERIADTIRIGDIHNGLNYDLSNEAAMQTASFVKKHCSGCKICRVCDLCPDVLKLPKEIVKTYCHNQRVLHKIKFLCFCELSEAELI